MLEQIIISFLLIGCSHALTSLTYSNCPTEFTPNTYNTSLALDSKSLGDAIYARLFSPQTQLAIQAAFNTGDLSTVQAYATSLSFLLPYILAASFFAALFIASVCCCTFDRRCPPCESWKRNYIKDPYSKL